MITTLNNDRRIYQIVIASGRQIFCNIGDLNKICKSVKELYEGEFKIYHFFNNKAKLLNKTQLDKHFEHWDLKRGFEYSLSW